MTGTRCFARRRASLVYPQIARQRLFSGAPSLAREPIARQGSGDAGACQYIGIDILFASEHTQVSMEEPKSSQLQIRVSRSEKTTIQRAAKRAGMDMSSYVLSRLISAPSSGFQECCAAAARGKSSSALAELNTLLTKLSTFELREAVALAPAVWLSPFIANYVAAMVELASSRRSIAVPMWTRTVIPLEDPWFANPSASLRHYLLTVSPAPFRRRNIFIDSSLGTRV